MRQLTRRQGGTLIPRSRQSARSDDVATHPPPSNSHAGEHAVCPERRCRYPHFNVATYDVASRLNKVIQWCRFTTEQGYWEQLSRAIASDGSADSYKSHCRTIDLGVFAKLITATAPHPLNIHRRRNKAATQATLSLFVAVNDPLCDMA